MQPALENETGELHYFTVSTYKLSIMYVMTLGLYAVYWFYKNWKLQQPLIEKNISPVWRSIFNIFFTHSLFKRVHLSAKQKNIPLNYSYKFIATVFVSLIVVSNIIGYFESADTFGAISLISMFLLVLGLYPLYVIQDTINIINNDPHGVFNSEITFTNYLFIIAGAFLWFFIVVAALDGFDFIKIIK